MMGHEYLLFAWKQPACVGDVYLWVLHVCDCADTDCVLHVKQGALASLNQVIPAVGKEASDLQKLSFVVGLVLLRQ